jgi:hypothetical protein
LPNPNGKGQVLLLELGWSDQIGGQLEAGFVLTHLYEDSWNDGSPIDQYLPSFLATRSMKLSH